MSTDLKLSKAQISKAIQSGGFLGSLLSKLAGPVMKVAVSLTKKKSFNTVRNNISCFSNRCSDSKENPWFRGNNFNNFEQRNE